ncbi:MAG TPA: L,D-transpeptidase [Xanthobacteraceae bacterium]|nr:L,D-transpeptidase [Xanthobacteraceae bacterium]
MRRIFASLAPATALCIAAGATALLLASAGGAAAQADAGRQLADADQTSYGGGFLQYLIGGGSAQPAARASRPAAQYQQTPRPRGLFQSFQWAPADQTTPQQSAAYDPAAGSAPSGFGHMAHAVDPQFDRQLVAFDGSEEPGTIIIDTPHFFLYLVEDGGKALRYGIGVGRPGFTWAGVKEISAMREWPEWRPPTDMLKRRPDLPRYMAGGPDNPLGARALYLGSTLYRIHGSNEPWTIGTQVSSGCIRMRNEDVTDLYGRVKVGTKVVVM